MRATKDTTPAAITRITEVGWWCDNATQDANFEVGLYSHHAGNDLPDAIEYSSIVNAKGTGSGWKTAVVNWDESAETIYCIAVQLDNTTPGTDIDYLSFGGRTSIDVSVSALRENWVSDGVTDYIMAIYAVCDEGATYSELSGDCAGAGAGSGDLELDTYSALAGTCAGIGSGSGDLGSVLVGISEYTLYKRLVVSGNNQIWYEDI